MQVIHKQILEITDKQKIMLPYGATILSVQIQREQLCLWYLHNGNPAVERVIGIYGTGNEIPFEDFEPMHPKFIATVQMRGGTLVWHVFELYAGD